MTAAYALARRAHDHCRTIYRLHQQAGNHAEAAIWHGRMLDYAHQMAAEEALAIPAVPHTATVVRLPVRLRLVSP